MKFDATTKKLLQNERVAALTILHAANVPHSAAMHFAWDEASGAFIFSTDRQSMKVQSLANGASAPAALVVGLNEKEMQTVQLHGTATILVNEPTLKETYYTKFPQNRQYENDPGGVLIKFTPTWARYANYTTDPPTMTETLIEPVIEAA